MCPAEMQAVSTQLFESFLQISDELASYEYLITMQKDLTEVGDDNATRSVVKFAVDKTSSILSNERKRLVALSEQCAKYPVDWGRRRRR